MDVHDPGRSVKPYIAIAVGDAWLRSEVVKGLASFYSLAEYPNISRALAGCREHVPLAVLVSEELPTEQRLRLRFHVAARRQAGGSSGGGAGRQE